MQISSYFRSDKRSYAEPSEYSFEMQENRSDQGEFAFLSSTEAKSDKSSENSLLLTVQDLNTHLSITSTTGSNSIDKCEYESIQSSDILPLWSSPNDQSLLEAELSGFSGSPFSESEIILKRED